MIPEHLNARWGRRGSPMGLTQEDAEIVYLRLGPVAQAAVHEERFGITSAATNDAIVFNILATEPHDSVPRELFLIGVA